jgi:hypothetical protein
MPPHDGAFDAERTRLATAVRALLDAGLEADAVSFETLAPELFAHQYAHNDAYREFCDAKGVTPSTLRDWRGIPAFPTDAFKAGIVTSFPPEQAVMAQLTSGTSANRRGQIFRDALGLELVLEANRAMTAGYLFPDFAQGQRCRILILAPSPQMAPSMGMAIGMEATRQHFGSPESCFLLDRGGIDVKALLRALEQSVKSGEPVAMIGSTSAFVFFLNACRDKGWSFELPAGSRIGDGGGYRGRFGEMSRDDYYALVEACLGIPSSHCVNVLGMAESATNFFEDSLRRAVLGLPEAVRQRPDAPWTRTVAVSSETLEPLPDGEIGLLRHVDLVNLPTVLAVQTDNLGYTTGEGGFQIVGRAKVVDGKVSSMPDERPVGPMGDKRIFRFLENYVNFSIRFRMGLLRRGGGSDYPPACPCVAVADEMIDATPKDAGDATSNPKAPTANN